MTIRASPKATKKAHATLALVRFPSFVNLKCARRLKVQLQTASTLTENLVLTARFSRLMALNRAACAMAREFASKTAAYLAQLRPLALSGVVPATVAVLKKIAPMTLSARLTRPLVSAGKVFAVQLPAPCVRCTTMTSASKPLWTTRATFLEMMVDALLKENATKFVRPAKAALSG
jgi:hypothetical protein